MLLADPNGLPGQAACLLLGGESGAQHFVRHLPRTVARPSLNAFDPPGNLQPITQPLVMTVGMRQGNLDTRQDQDWRSVFSTRQFFALPGTRHSVRMRFSSLASFCSSTIRVST